jgi:hypothetical protein
MEGGALPRTPTAATVVAIAQDRCGFAHGPAGVTEHARHRRRRIRTWMAVSGGLVLGFAAALAGRWAFTTFGDRVQSVPDTCEVASEVDLFRLPSGASREMFLVPAGPDANGEPALARALYPGEEPPRELASLLLANVSADEPWPVDFEQRPLACRRDAAGAWTPLERLSSASGTRLAPAELLRLRSLGADASRLVVEPRSLRRVLVALPPKCRIGDLSGVQWGETPLVRDKLALERIRLFREDPAAVTMGR